MRNNVAKVPLLFIFEPNLNLPADVPTEWVSERDATSFSG
jgi:hypothetical protein